MTLQIPDTISKKIKLTEAELLLELSVQLYQRRLLSMRASAELAGISWVKFEEILAQRGISLQYDVNDLKKDLENLKNI